MTGYNLIPNDLSCANIKGQGRVKGILAKTETKPKQYQTPY